MNVCGGVPVDTSFHVMPYTPGPEMFQAPCQRCGLSLWIGPKVARKVAGGIPLLCPFCMLGVDP